MSQDVIGKWTGFVDDHQQYNTSRNSCQKWLNDLAKRLAQCKDMGGDKQAMEEKQSSIQVQ